MTRFILPFGLAVGLSVSMVSDTDAQRQGFIIGFGAGPSVTTGDVDSKVGVSTDFKIGGMAGKSVQLYCTSKWSFFSEDGAAIAAGLHGLGVTHQWPSGFNINGTAGVATWIDFDWDAYVGIGLGAGVGYEFADRWVVNLGGAWGRREDINVFNLALTISVLSH